MATADDLPEVEDTLAELIEQLGDIPLHRIRLKPPPGTATEKDVLAALKGPRKRLCELVDGVLVEKPMGTTEALLGGVIVHRLWTFVEPEQLGAVLPADGLLRLMPGLVRIPDVSFISWDNIPGRRFTKAPIAPYIPDLAVEVVSRSNTKKEIQRKLREYFLAGTRLAWVIHPKTQTAQEYRSPEEFRRVAKNGLLRGDPVLPGFTLSLAELFASTAQRPKKRA